MKPLVLLGLVSTCVFAQTPPAKPAPAKSAPAKKSGPVKKAPATTSSAKLMNPAAWTQQAPANFKARFTTTKGDFVIEVHRAWAPLGADRFYNLVRSGYFTNVSFYRIVPNFVVQFGAAPDPKVGAAWSRARIADDPVKQSNTKGRVTFAMGGPGSRTTEVFINLADNSRLDAYPGGAFAPIGEVTEGMEVVESLYGGYGDLSEQGGNGPSQAKVQTEGKAYLDKVFPNLDNIKSATIAPGAATSPAGVAPTPKPTAPKATPKTAAPAKKVPPAEKK